MLDRPTQLPVVCAPAAAAPLVMLPGTLCDERLFSPLLDELNVAASILPIEGASTASAMASIVLASAPPKFSLCGFSLGAIVALAVVAEAPERVERLALIGCNPGALDPKARAARAELDQQDFVAASSPPSDLPLRRLVDNMADATSAEAYASQTLMTLARPDRRDQLSWIDVPTLVICGERDPICPATLSKQIAGAVPGARLVLVPGAGHYVTLERPEIVAAELSAWLATPTRLQ